MAASFRFLPFLVSSALKLQYTMASASGMGMGVHHLELPRGSATCGGTAEGRHCHFPFTHTNGITYTACTDVDRDGNWCYVTPDRPGLMDNRLWGYCDCTSTTVVAGSSGQNASSGVTNPSNTTEESAYSESVLERNTSPTTSMAVSGRLEYYMVDDFDHNEHKKIGAVYDADGKPTWFEVDAQLKHLRPGDTVEVILQIKSGSSSVHNETSFDSPAKVVASKVISEGSQAGLYGVRHGRDNSTSTSNRRQRRTTDGVDERSVLAITVLLPEVNAVPYCDNDCIHDMWWRGTHTIDGVFNASSYGLVRFPGVLFRHEVVELSGNLSQFDGCEYDRIATMVDTILQSRLGFSTYWGYNHFAYYIPLEIQNCAWGGLAQVNGGLMWLRSSSAAVTAHELAHNIGLNHGSSDFDDDNLQDAEYGDVTDVCGSTSIFTEMNGPHRVQLEYIPLRAIYEVPHADVLATCSSYNARGLYQWPSYTYRGNASTTRSGLTCQGWNTMWPWSHPYTSTNYPSRGLGDHNYCRDPDGTGAPWCVTSDTNDPNLWWDFCDIDCRQEAEVFPVLSEADRCDTTPKHLDLAPLTKTPDFGRNHPSIVQIARQQGGFYFISLRTASGIFDQSLVDTPSMVNAVYIHYQAGETSNTHLIDWLQPGEEFREPTTGWRVQVGNFSCSNETSSIPILLDLCPTNWTAVEHESCHGSKGANYAGYRGNVSTTSCGTPCINWDDGPMSNYDEDYEGLGLGNHTYCRNPDESDGAWCYTNASTRQWGYCSVCSDDTIGSCASEQRPEQKCPCGGEEEYVAGYDYRGDLNVTVSGRICQAWSSQTPNTHYYTPERYPYSGLEGNACRNPGGASGSLWCYTIDGGRWDNCGSCPDSNPAPILPVYQPYSHCQIRRGARALRRAEDLICTQ